jgi:hypothetical protein
MTISEMTMDMPKCVIPLPEAAESLSADLVRRQLQQRIDELNQELERLQQERDETQRLASSLGSYVQCAGCSQWQFLRVETHRSLLLQHRNKTRTMAIVEFICVLCQGKGEVSRSCR